MGLVTLSLDCPLDRTFLWPLESILCACGSGRWVREREDEREGVGLVKTT